MELQDANAKLQAKIVDLQSEVELLHCQQILWDSAWAMANRNNEQLSIDDND